MPCIAYFRGDEEPIAPTDSYGVLTNDNIIPSTPTSVGSLDPTIDLTSEFTVLLEFNNPGWIVSITQGATTQILRNEVTESITSDLYPYIENHSVLNAIECSQVDYDLPEGIIETTQYY